MHRQDQFNGAGTVPSSGANHYEKLKPLVTDKCPFVNLPETGRARWGEILDAEKMKQCVWVRPEIVVQIEFLEWTEAEPKDSRLGELSSARGEQTHVRTRRSHHLL
jgi:ATP-dependent DNA ligase